MITFIEHAQSDISFLLTPFCILIVQCCLLRRPKNTPEKDDLWLFGVVVE